MNRQSTSASTSGKAYSSRSTAYQEERDEKEDIKFFSDFDEDLSEGEGRKDGGDPSFSGRGTTVARVKSAGAGSASAGNNGNKPKPRKRPMKSIKVSDSPLAEEDDENDDGDGDDEEEFSGVQVNHLLSKLGNQLQQRARAKKQRMDELFKAVKSAPANTFASRMRQAQQRQKVFAELQGDTVKVSERLDNIIQLQAINEDKHTKMMISLGRGSEQVRVGISECIKSQAVNYENFMTALKELDEKQESGTQQLLERCAATLRELKKRLVADAVNSETESLSQMKFYA